jgi:hypothetical protein
MIGNTCKDVAQVDFRIETVELCGSDQREDGCSAFAAFVRPRE